VKKLKPDLAEHAQILARFKREAEILSRLDHPGIIQVLDTLEYGSDHYIVMPYVEGGDLRSLLKEGPIPFKKAVKLGAEIADALARVHQLDIVHRDIKPENVLLTADGVPRLTDFGVSYVHGATRLTETQTIVGTFQYMAPEVLQGSSPSKQSDIWSFGILLYEMLTGNQPFLRTTVSQIVLAILNEPIPDVRINCKVCTEAIANLIAKSLERDPAKRISSMDEAAGVLERVQ
jgi:serine/threonine-protein kinase